MTEPVPITHRLRRAQGESHHTLHLLHKIGKVEVYQRCRFGEPIDLAVVRGARTVHGATITEAMRQLREQLAQQPTSEGKILDWQTGLDAGFSEKCLKSFCRDNELDPNGTITLSALRRRLMQRRNLNLSYAKPLRAVGIILPNPPTP
jgi:hypothetical protein